MSVLVQTVKVVNYVLNQEEYIAQFCENKNVPDSNCKGTCHLSKELKLSANDITSQTSDFVPAIVSIFSFQQVIDLKPRLLNLDEVKGMYILKRHVQEQHIKSIFRPPIV